MRSLVSTTRWSPPDGGGHGPDAAWVPLPWCTAQSKIAMRSTAVVARTWQAAIARLEKIQKPMPVSGVAW